MQFEAYQPPKYMKYADEVTRKYIREVKKEYGLICSGTGGGLSKDVEMLHFQLIAYEKADIEKARELEIKCTEKLVSMMNAHEKMRPFLRNYPITPKNARVSIIFCDKYNRPYYDGSIFFVFQCKNTVHYDQEDEASGKLITVYQEPYEEAKVLVLSENPLTVPEPKAPKGYFQKLVKSLKNSNKK